MKKEKVLYYYRGLMKRVCGNGESCSVAGYSVKSSSGGISYPWLTKEECRREAEANGKVALFVRF